MKNAFMTVDKFFERHAAQNCRTTSTTNHFDVSDIVRLRMLSMYSRHKESLLAKLNAYTCLKTPPTSQKTARRFIAKQSVKDNIRERSC